MKKKSKHRQPETETETGDMNNQSAWASANSLQSVIQNGSYEAGTMSADKLLPPIHSFDLISIFVLSLVPLVFFLFILKNAHSAIAPQVLNLKGLNMHSQTEVQKKPAETETSILEAKLKTIMQERYPSAHFETRGLVRIGTQLAISDVSNFDVRITNESPKGELQFEIINRENRSLMAQATVAYSLLQNVWIARKRFYTSQALSKSDFELREVDVAREPFIQYRGILVEAEAKIDRFEAKQSILEGTALTTNSIQIVPSVKRGGSITLRMRAGDLVVTTLATADEPGRIGEPIRVTTLKTKRTLVGILSEDGMVDIGEATAATENKARTVAPSAPTVETKTVTNDTNTATISNPQIENKSNESEVR